MKLKLFFVVCILILSGLGVHVHGQKSVSYQNQQWIQYYNTAKINDSWVIKTDGGYRVKNNFSEASQYIARIALAYKLDPYNMQTEVGIANLGFYAGDSLSRVETRPYVGLIINDKYPGFKIQHRLRLEYRNFKTLQTGVVSSNMRYRYRFFVNIPIAKLSPKNKSMELSINAGDEIFINSGSKIVYNVFNQNRILVGPSLQVNKNLAFTLTYTAEYGAKSTAGDYKYSNILWLGIKHKMDVRKNNGKESGQGSGTGRGHGGGTGGGDGTGGGKRKDKK